MQMRHVFLLISWACYKEIIREAVAHRIGLTQQLKASCIHEKICTGELYPTELYWDLSGDNHFQPRRKAGISKHTTLSELYLHLPVLYWHVQLLMLKGLQII